MNEVILISWVKGDETHAFYINLRVYIIGSVCRMDFIQRALERVRSQLSNARSPNIFEPFLTFLDQLEVKNFYENIIYAPYMPSNM